MHRRRYLGWLGLGFVLAAAGLVAACVGDDPITRSGDTAGADAGSAAETGTEHDASIDPADARGQDAADAAPTPRCDPSKAFGPGAVVDVINGPTSAESHATLTSDELTIFFASDRTGGVLQIFSATRTSKSAAFGTPAQVQNLDGSEAKNPSVSGTNTSIFFDSPRATVDAGSGPSHIFVSTRTSAGVLFPTPGALYGTGFLQTGSLTSDGNVLYVTDLSSGGIGRLSKAGAGFGPVEAIANVGNDYSAASPVSGDDLTLYIASGRPGSKGGTNIWFHTRSATSAAYGSPTELTSTSTDGDESPSWISPDGCHLYYTGRPSGGGNDIYMAARPL